MDRWKLPRHVAFQKWSYPSHKIWLWKAMITLCQSDQVSFGENSWDSTRATICLQIQISDILHLKQIRLSTIMICSQPTVIDHCYLFTVHWDHLLIQLNQVWAYKKVLKKMFFPLVNRIFIILWQVENRILGLKYPWNSTDQPITFLKILVNII